MSALIVCCLFLLVGFIVIVRQFLLVLLLSFVFGVFVCLFVPLVFVIRLKRLLVCLCFVCLLVGLLFVVGFCCWFLVVVCC